MSNTVNEGPLARMLGTSERDHGDTRSQTTLVGSRTVRVVWRGRLAEETFLFGSWDAWAKGRRVTKSDSIEEYVVVLELNPGRYESKYRTCSGIWFHNPTMPTTMNVFGTLNNILIVSGSPNIGTGEQGEKMIPALLPTVKQEDLGPAAVPTAKMEDLGPVAVPTAKMEDLGPVA
ncbi:PREDICTED: uncharacterized protein LOC109462289, partial [Branchiostoma belcheri]|uniref:5'-AMP-activated protein kinase subunit beta-1 n=1 Tax=Branchiostoma belcheri TaxID=7741 RepID=A0A6P4XQI5_BRABE